MPHVSELVIGENGEKLDLLSGQKETLGHISNPITEMEIKITSC